jgi:hypothetical protein
VYRACQARTLSLRPPASQNVDWNAYVRFRALGQGHHHLVGYRLSASLRFSAAVRRMGGTGLWDGEETWEDVACRCGNKMR